MTNIFEHPCLLLIVAGVVFLGVAFFRDLLPPRRAWVFWLLPIVIAIAAFAIDYLVQTDKEKIESVLAKASRAVEKEDIRAIEPLIWENYSDSVHPSKQELLDHFRRQLSEPVIEKIVPAIVSLEIKPAEATVVFTARVMFDPRGPVYEYQKMMLFKLEANLTKDGSEWFFSRTEILTINLQPAGWKNTQGGAGEIF
ncbi:MAG: hypothetical protein ABSB25_03900 [Sedimentisphaerales bacterium]|jgi:hypothetical protein